MKRFSLFIAILFSSCKEKVEVMRFADADGDGWNSYNISLFDDNTYTRVTIFPNEPGDWSIANDTIYFRTGALENKLMIFRKDSLGCVSSPKLISSKNTADMQILFDSLFCHRNVLKPQ